MKIRHKINHGWAPDNTDPAWAERVEQEAEATSAAAAHDYAKAQERLARAEKRLAEAKQGHNTTKIKRLKAQVEERRAELGALARLMKQSPAGSQHRGKGSYRGIGGSQ